MLLCCIFANAQITITSADMPAVGNTFPAWRDTMPLGFSVGQSGANRTWDFSALQPDVADTTHAVAPSSTPYAAGFPNASLALTNDFSGYLFYRNTAAALKAEGFANIDPNLGVVSVNFNPIPDQYRFPASYLTAFSGSSGFQEAKPYAQLPANIQSQIDAAMAGCINPNATVTQVRVTFTSTYKDTIDAWGKVITPLGEYDAIRRKRIEDTRTVIDVQTNCFFVTQWIPIDTILAITTEHSWLSAITKLPLIQLGYDSARNISLVTYSATPPPPVAGFTWSNITGGLINFTNTSQNSPTAFHWDFGDGDTSDLQNPSHSYSANGAYYVCLTAANASGSNTFCDSVHVTGIGVNRPPVAVRDSAYAISPYAVQVDALGNDYDPDGDSVIYVIFTGALNGNVARLLSGMFEYTPNAGFMGVDSFEYIIRDDGNPSLRDTGAVVIRVDGLPTASFVYSASGLSVRFESTSTNYDQLSWDFDDVVTDTATIVTHAYASGNLYNVCLTATNGVGADDTCRTVDLRGVGIGETRNSGIRIYPNPAANEARVSTGNLTIEKAEVMSAEGRAMLVKAVSNITGELNLNVSALSRGFYICRLTADDGSIVAAKLVIE